MTSSSYTLIVLALAIILFAAVNFVTVKRFFRAFSKAFLYFELTTSRKHLYMATFYDEVYDFLAELEFKERIRLSEEAKQLLILPLIEVRKIIVAKRSSEVYPLAEEYVNALESWRESVTKIVRNVKNEPAMIDKNRRRFTEIERSSISVIKAFADKFCDIPPFCKEK